MIPSCEAERYIYRAGLDRLHSKLRVSGRASLSPDDEVLTRVAVALHRVQHTQLELSQMQVLAADGGNYSLGDQWGRYLSAVEASVENWAKQRLGLDSEQLRRELDTLGRREWPVLCAKLATMPTTTSPHDTPGT